MKKRRWLYVGRRTGTYNPQDPTAFTTWEIRIGQLYIKLHDVTWDLLSYVLWRGHRIHVPAFLHTCVFVPLFTLLEERWARLEAKAAAQDPFHGHDPFYGGS